MKRLPQGALIGKLKATILASALLLSSFPAEAQDSSGDTTIRTMAPLPAPSASTSADQTSSSQPGLAYTAGGDAQAAPQAVPNSDVPPAVASDLAPSAPSETASGEATASSGRLTPGVADVQAAGNSDSSQVTGAVGQPLETKPEPLIADSSNGNSNTSGESSDNDGKQLAQAASKRPLLDPAYRKLPGVSGNIVKIKQTFRLFATQQLIHNLSFRDTPVKEVIAEIARRGNLNIVIDKSVIGRITGELHDVTLNEAMDSVLKASGYEYRELDNSTTIIGTRNSLFSLGLNRPMARVFKLSYAVPFDVANMLWASVFNRGVLLDFNDAVATRVANSGRESPSTKTAEQIDRASAGASGNTKSSSISTSESTSTEDTTANNETNLTSRPDSTRTIRGSTRVQIVEGTGFNNGATDPGSQTIRAYQEIVTDFNVEQNAGGTIVIPDMRNRQIIVVGTQDDLNVAEEAIRLLDRRPKQVHIQAALIELSNQGIRQVGAALNLQGEGASGTVLGGSGAPMIQFLPGMGTFGPLQRTQTVTDLLGTTLSQIVQNQAGIPPVPVSFTSRGPATIITDVLSQATGVVGPLGQGFNGILGNALPVTLPSIAGVQSVPQAQTGFNFLSLSKRAGGRANIATMPAGLNMSLNLVLQTNKAKLLANPSVTVSDNTETLITLANEVVHKVTSTISLGVVSVNVELVQAGIFLDVLPKVTEDGFITMRVRPQVSSPLGAPQTFAGGNVVVTLLNIRQIMTQEVRVKQGQTLIIGGLFTETESATLGKVPYLAEAPILGALFRNSLKGRNRTELMLLITPSVVEEQPNQIGDSQLPGPTM